MNEWEELKLRYGSNRQYLNRNISISSSKIEEFKNYLIDCGADILLDFKKNEMFRFKLNGNLGIVYSKGSGNLLAHNMAAEFHRMIGQDSTELYLKDQYYSKF